jgi:P27 family predicted phage terminase small subunit
MRGRKPKPTHLKEVAGNPGRRPLNKAEPKPKGDLFACPDHLSADQAAGWSYAIASAPKGLLKRLDRSALVAWVVAEDMHRQSTVALNAGGLVVNGKTSPYIGILNRQAHLMLRAAEQLGFTPTSRGRIEIDPADLADEGEYDFAEFG